MFKFYFEYMIPVETVKLALIFCCLLHASAEPFKIAAFNVQVFGLKKANDANITQILAKIIQRYDIILIQEIREPTGRAISILLDAVNQLGPNRYMNITSGRLGRTNSKEQYVFLYRPSKDLVVEDIFQDADASDFFQREPFSVRFKAKKTALKSFTLMALHVDPGDAVKELMALPAAVQNARHFFQNDDLLILGDLNAGCSFVSKKALNDVRKQSPQLVWLIPDTADTTVSNNRCAYDRFISHGDKMLNAVKPETASVFQFDVECNISQNEALNISDHYPIEIEFNSKKKFLGR